MIDQVENRAYTCVLGVREKSAGVASGLGSAGPALAKEAVVATRSTREGTPAQEVLVLSAVPHLRQVLSDGVLFRITSSPA